MFNDFNVAILGATSNIGRAIFKMLIIRKFPAKEIFALASNKSAGKHEYFTSGKTLVIQDAAKFNWKQVQLAFFAVAAEIAVIYIEKATNSGCLVIDLSGLSSLKPEVPLVLPAVNASLLIDYRNCNIIAVPNSLTSQLLIVLKPLVEEIGLAYISVTNLLSVSAKGRKAIATLAIQSAKLLNGISVEKNNIFIGQLAFNMLPMLPSHEGIVYEERCIVDEVRKILKNDLFNISVSCIQSPVFYGHAQMVNFKALRPMFAEEVCEILSYNKNIQLSKKNNFSTQVENATNNNTQLSVSCIRNNYGIPGQIQFWSVADNIYFGSALIAIQIAEKIVQRSIR